MAPNPELPVFNVDSIIPPYVPPLPEVPLFEANSLSDDDFSSSTNSDAETHQQQASIYEPIEIPIEQNLRELLVSEKNLPPITTL